MLEDRNWSHVKVAPSVVSSTSIHLEYITVSSLPLHLSTFSIPTLHQPPPLPPLLIKIPIRQPSLKPLLTDRPLRIQNRIPATIPIPPLNDHMLSKTALIDKAIPFRRLLRWPVQRITFPLPPSVLQFLKHKTAEQIEHFRPGSAPLQLGPEQDMSHFDDSVGKIRAEEADVSDGFSLAWAVVEEDGIEGECVALRYETVDVVRKIGGVAEWPVRHEIPNSGVGTDAVVEVGDMFLIETFEGYSFAG